MAQVHARRALASAPAHGPGACKDLKPEVVEDQPLLGADPLAEFLESRDIDLVGTVLIQSDEKRPAARGRAGDHLIPGGIVAAKDHPLHDARLLHQLERAVDRRLGDAHRSTHPRRSILSQRLDQIIGVEQAFSTHHRVENPRPLDRVLQTLGPQRATESSAERLDDPKFGLGIDRCSRSRARHGFILPPSDQTPAAIFFSPPAEPRPTLHGDARIGRSRDHLRLAATIGLSALLCVAIASIGGPHGPALAAASLAWWLLIAGWPVAVFVLASYGLGWLVRPWWGASDHARAIRLISGVALLLMAGQIINSVGSLFPGMAWNLAAWAPALLGLALLARRTHVNDAAEEEASPASDGAWRWLAGAVLALPVSVLLVASVQPPGWLWDSEFGGFDSLSYHLQLPQEWLALGRMTPLAHNVYSALPSSIESAFLTLQLWTFAPRQASPSEAMGMLAGEGWRTLSCHLLHAAMALIAGAVVWSATTAAGRRDGRDASGACGPLATAALWSVPWLIVVGSLAYNEAGVVAIFAGAMLVAFDRAATPVGRAILTALLVGAACTLKPTALFFIAPTVGVVLLLRTPRHAWPLVIGVGIGVGLCTLLPWLVRNAIVLGNPVFPYARAIFGDAGWSAEQHARFAAAHHFSGGIAERLSLTLFPDPSDPAGPRHRGLAHSQWSIFLPLVLVAGCLGVWSARTRATALILLASLVAQWVAWLSLTHLQSRFLITMLVPGAMLIGLAPAAFTRWRTPVLTVLLLASGYMGIRSLDHFWVQREGRPNLLLTSGPSVLVARDWRTLEGGGTLDGRILLLGESTPFYWTGPLAYSTTWDLSALGAIARRSPAPAMDEATALRWSRALREAGFQGVLINPGEIARLARTGWFDPALSPDVVRSWVERGTRVRRVLESGHVLVEPLDAGPTTATPEPRP